MSSKVETEKTENRIIKYFREARAEMRKVTWPTREEALNLTGIVVAVTTVMALLLWGLDVVFEGIIAALIGA
ncbi:MAG: preprotein translocase subunit SecE [Anaerolineae bacterium]